MPELHDVIFRAYSHAASSHLDQFRTIALTSVTDFFHATGAFWGFAAGIDNHSGNAQAVVVVGETPGALSGVEHYGPDNPNWPTPSS